MDTLEQSILGALSFFDIFDYPLTPFEIWKWLYIMEHGTWNMEHRVKIFDIQKILDESEELQTVIEHKDGFYFLKGRGKIIQTRYKRARIAEQKFKKALKIARLLALIPFVRMIAVSNDLAYNNAPEGGDIDLFIIARSGRIWMTRFFCVMLLKLLRARPTPRVKKDKICLSFFVTDDNLNLEPIALKPEASGPEGLKARRDIYLTYWTRQLVPIYDEGVYEKFLAANQWTRKFLPNALPVNLPRRKIEHAWFWWTTKKVLEWLNSFSFNGISERFYRWLQLKILPKELKELAGRGTAVIVTDRMLKFHKVDQREYFQRRFDERYERALTKYEKL